MKFHCSVEIDLPVDEVVELFDNTENLKEWQDGFLRFEPISGIAGEVDSKARMIYKMGSREMELIETIKVKNLPEEMTGLYEHKHMVNTMTTRFKALGTNKTKYEADIEYLQFNGFVPKMMAFLMPGMFKRQTQKWLNQFKNFAEKNA